MIKIERGDTHTQVSATVRDFSDFIFKVLEMDEAEACRFLMKGMDTEEWFPENMIRLKLAVDNLESYAEENNELIFLMPVRLIKNKLPAITIAGLADGIPVEHCTNILHFMMMPIDEIRESHYTVGKN